MKTNKQMLLSGCLHHSQDHVTYSFQNHFTLCFISFKQDHVNSPYIAKELNSFVPRKQGELLGKFQGHVI